MYTGLGLFAISRTRAQVSRHFALVMFLATAWAVNYNRELLASGIADKLFWFKCKFLAILFVPPAWLALVQSFVRGPRWLGKQAWTLLLIVPVISIPLVLTTEHHHLFRHSFRIEHVRGLAILKDSWGPLAQLQMLMGYIFSFLSLVVLVAARRNAPAVVRRQLTMLLLAYLIPLALNVAFNLNVGLLPGINLSMFSLVFTAWLWIWALFRYGTLNLVPFAHALLIENLPWEVLVLDSAGRLADANRAAASKLGLDLKLAIGVPATDVIPKPWRALLPSALHTAEETTLPIPSTNGKAGSWYERTVTPLSNQRGDHVGVIILLRDVTDRIRLEGLAREAQRLRAERKHARQIELFVRDLHDGIGGITANIGIMATLGQQSPATEAKDGVLTRITQLATEGSSEVRALMNGLESRELSWQDLIAELRRYGTISLEEHQIELSLTIEGEPPRQGPDLFPRLSFTKIYKEALNNVVKHAKATAVDVVLRFDESTVFLTVHDNGCGLPALVPVGRGLRNIKKRVQELGGELQMHSENGLALNIALPVGLAAPDQDEEGNIYVE